MNLTDCKVSIIIPIYNRATLIEKCIRSVQEQTLENLEIVCVDDGSTDNSIDVVQTLMNDDNRIRLFMQNNHGAAVARNNGINYSSGKYISFLDSDDFYLDPNALLEMTENAEKEGALVCGAKGKMLTEGKFSDYYTADVIDKKNKAGWISFEDYQSDRGYCCFIYNRKWIIDNNIFFPDYMEYEDPVFFLKVMSLAGKFYFVPNYLLAVRVWNHSNEERRKRAITDILKGIYSNLLVSRQSHYHRLFENIINNISMEYRMAILNAISDEVMMRLLKIQEVAYSVNNDYKLEILEDIYRAARQVRFYRKSNERLLPEYFKNIILVQGEEVLGNFFSNLGISKVVMYGAGNYGNAFYIIALKSNVEVIAVMDEHVLMWDDMRVIKPDYADLPENTDAIIVTLYEYKDVVDKLKRQFNIPVFSFMEIISEIENSE